MDTTSAASICMTTAAARPALMNAPDRDPVAMAVSVQNEQGRSTVSQDSIEGTRIGGVEITRTNGVRVGAVVGLAHTTAPQGLKWTRY